MICIAEMESILVTCKPAMESKWEIVSKSVTCIPEMGSKRVKENRLEMESK